jgi:superoxide reductase
VEEGVLTVKVGAVAHPMVDAHHIEWIAVETTLGNQRKELDPLGKPEAEFALLPGEKVKAVYEYCNLHGLWKHECEEC